MTNCKYKLRKLSVGLVSVGTMFMASTVMGEEVAEISKANEMQPVLSTQSNLASDKANSEQTEDKKTLTVAENSQEDAFKNAQTSQQASPSTEQKDEPQLMEVEKIKVNKPNTNVKVIDGKVGNSKLIANRDEKQREIFDVSRAVKINEDNTIDVALTVTPKQIDEGAEVIIILDTSQKMTEDDFNTAKDNIKKLVTTLTSTNTKNHNNRNSIRLIDFYREVGTPINLSGFSEVDTEKKLTEVREKAKKNYNGWGVDLQGAIHKARQIFNHKNEKNSGKRQHIVLFSQGESTFSYDVTNKTNLEQEVVKEPITSSNLLLPWFDRTTDKANLVTDGEKLLKLLESLGFNRYQGLLNDVASNGNTFLGLGSAFLGTNNPLDYITLADLNTKNTTDFNYSKRLGEGYNHRSYYKQEKGSIPLETAVKNAIKKKLKEIHQKSDEKWIKLDSLGLNKLPVAILDIIGIKGKADSAEEVFIDYVVDSLFSKRNYVYHNHNLSAQAEAKMARDEGIVFYSFDVTDPNRATKESKPNNHSKEYQEYLNKKAEEAKKNAEKRNEKFDKYLKEMSDGRNFLKEVGNKDTFKDVLAEIKLTETFEKYVNVQNNSWQTSLDSTDTKGNKQQNINHSSASSGWFTSSNESLTWTIPKEQLKTAFETEQPLTLTYKLNINSSKFKEILEKRSIPTENNNKLTKKIISNIISYQINSKSAKGPNLEDVTLTYTKEMVPVPEINEKVTEPQPPQLIDLPEVPSISEYGPNLNFEEETIHQLPLEHGHYTPNTQITFEEDTKSESLDITVGGNVIDFTEDSIDDLHTESGHNSSKNNQDSVEDTKANSTVITINGQSDPVEMTEDTQAEVSGHSGDITITEDTKGSEIIISGQSDPMEMTEDTQPGMSGFNDATIIEETEQPKLQFHFDNEKPATTTQTIVQSPIAKVENKLPQTGDSDKLETFFNVTALTVIGAAGLLGKKRRENQID